MPPKPPLMVDQVIPRAIEVLQHRQERILALTSSGAPIVQPELTRAIALCRQILDPEET